MKLRVNVAELKERINIALEQHHKDYIILLGKYSQKLVEYQKYIARQVIALQDGKLIPGDLKYHPSQPNNSTQNLVKHLNGLNMHQNEEIELTSDELDDITNGIERLRDNVRASGVSLNSINYAD